MAALTCVFNTYQLRLSNLHLLSEIYFAFFKPDKNAYLAKKPRSNDLNDFTLNFEITMCKFIRSSHYLFFNQFFVRFLQTI